MAWELVLLDNQTRFILEMGKEYYVGSGSHVHIKLVAPDVSGVHALLTVTPEGVRLVDLGSKNGTFHNGKRVTAARIDNGDTVSFSSAKVQFFRTPAPPPAPTVSPFAEPVPSQTAEFPVAQVEEDLAELLRGWDTDPEQAPHTLLSWMVARRKLTACALLEACGPEVLVHGAQGPIPSQLSATGPLAELLANQSRSTAEVFQLPDSQPVAFLCPLGQCKGLLLVAGKLTPSAGELELFARLARLSLRLARA
ncbi:MAG: FHA domain-containing protein [Thermoanaerobaculum sp.]|nr:FHA domain-containing protein [Thermoanaerobaculum sp.]MDW7966989.1 FHA domain-containing protein [Thermoanaerobaculum sp.]